MLNGTQQYSNQQKPIRFQSRTTFHFLFSNSIPATAVSVFFAISAFFSLPDSAVARPNLSTEEINRAIGSANDTLQSLPPINDRADTISTKNVEQIYNKNDFHKAAFLASALQNQPSHADDAALALIASKAYAADGDVASAHRILQPIIDNLHSAFRDEAVALYLQSMVDNDDYRDATEISVKLAKSGKLKPPQAILLAKALMNDNQFGLALLVLEPLAELTSWKMKATFMIGACHVGNHDLKKAVPFFQQIVSESQGTKTEAKSRTYELSLLALGRIAYDEDRFDDAIQWYNKLPHQTPLYNQMMWEKAWTYLAKNDLVAANRTLELLLLEDLPSQLKTDATLLNADLNAQLHHYERAKKAYIKVARSLLPAFSDMNRFVAYHQDITLFFNDLAGTISTPPFQFSTTVTEFLNNSKAAKLLQRLYATLRQIRADDIEAKNAIDDVAEALHSDNPFFAYAPTMRSYNAASEAEVALTDVLESLVAKKFEAAKSLMSDDAVATFRESHISLTSLTIPELVATPTSSNSVTAFSGMATQRRHLLEHQRTELDLLRNDINYLKAQLQVIESYLAANRAEQPDRDEIDAIFAERNAIRDSLDRLQQRCDTVAMLVDKIRHNAAFTPSNRLSAERRRFEQLREYHADLIDGYKALQQRASNEILDRLFEHAVALEQSMANYYTTLNETAKAHRAEVEQALANARSTREVASKQLEEKISQLTEKTAVLAYLNFHDTRKKFEDYITLGEVGITDVTWLEKRDATDALKTTYQEEATQLKELQEKFDRIRAAKHQPNTETVDTEAKSDGNGEYGHSAGQDDGEKESKQ